MIPHPNEKIEPHIVKKITPRIVLKQTQSSETRGETRGWESFDSSCTGAGHSSGQGDGPWYCYCIKTGNCRSYIGKTNNLDRRLRQHNEEIAGGARSTRGRGPWTYAFWVSGFRTEEEVLCFEWAMHHPQGLPRKRRRAGLDGALAALVTVCNKERWTRKCPPACERPLKISLLNETNGTSEVKVGLEVPRWVEVEYLSGGRFSS